MTTRGPFAERGEGEACASPSFPPPCGKGAEFLTVWQGKRGGPPLFPPHPKVLYARWCCYMLVVFTVRPTFNVCGASSRSSMTHTYPLKELQSQGNPN